MSDIVSGETFPNQRGLLSKCENVSKGCSSHRLVEKAANAWLFPTQE